MITMTATQQDTKTGCNCGGDGHAECCELECLVQPRFFCGQLLADQDLTAIVDWVKAKSGLSRFRHGWGIVCGLEVHGETKGSINVAPGYALDCCGRDVVVCEQTTFDLTTCWQRPADPCNDNGSTANAEVKLALAVNPAHFGGLAIPQSEVQIFDLFIRYSESQSDSRTALARGGCSGGAGCEYTRVHEGFKLYCRRVADCEDPVDQWAQSWLTGYQHALAELLGEIPTVNAANPFATVQNLIDFLQKHPLHTFCFVREWLCDLQKMKELPNGWYEGVVFWIVQDWRNDRFDAACRGCGPDTGIRLARVWLRKQLDSHGNETVSTVYVNAYAPFRRALASDTWPTPPDSINLAPFIWRKREEACWPLRRLGVEIRPVELTNISELKKPETLFLPCPGQDIPARLILHHYTDYCGDERIVYFSRDDNAQPLTAPDHTMDTPHATPQTTPLEQLSGVGPATAERLKAAGILSVEDLAKADPDTVLAALDGLGAVPLTKAGASNLVLQAQQKLNPSAPGA